MSNGGRPTWQQPARGGRLGNGFFLLLIRCGGLWLAPLFLFWVAWYFVCAAPTGRRASFDLCRRLGRGRGLLRRLWFAHRHFYTFGMLLLDRVAILSGGEAEKYRIEFDGEEHIRQALQQGRGAVLLTGHLGNWEAMGHLLTRLEAPFCMVMLDTVPAQLKATMEAMAAQRSFKVLYTDGSPASAAAIIATLREGQIVGMMGDRVMAGESAEVDFLDGVADLPLGAYVVAAAAQAPLLHVFALRRGWRRYSFHGFPADLLRYRDRRRKREDLQRWAQGFATRLEGFLRQAPYQWGNFFAFVRDQRAR